jgi:(S)-ureidoglycine aminohydrolase
MEISALTRTVVKKTHALITPDGFVSSYVPGWINCTVNVLINEQMGANLCQILITLNKDGKITGVTNESQVFFYVISGSCKVNIEGDKADLKTGQFVYVPLQKKYSFKNSSSETKILTFHKVYEELHGYDMPDTIIGDTAKIKSDKYFDDPALRLQTLLPDVPSFDMAVNIFSYDPGGHLPFVETHIMEHGLMYLQGQGIYMLDDEWYPVKKGDSIWMAPYCRQWFTAMGKEPAVYIYYKNVNRFPTRV